MISTLLFCLFLPTSTVSAQEPAAPTKGRIVNVYDGDTMTLESGDKIRLRWVNTPELRPLEDYGIEDREAAKVLIMGQKRLLGEDHGLVMMYSVMFPGDTNSNQIIEIQILVFDVLRIYNIC